MFPFFLIYLKGTLSQAIYTCIYIFFIQSAKNTNENANCMFHLLSFHAANKILKTNYYKQIFMSTNHAKEYYMTNLFRDKKMFEN